MDHPIRRPWPEPRVASDARGRAPLRALSRFLFSHEAALQAVGTLSAVSGYSRRSRACSAVRDLRLVLVLDEPTNYLDIDSLEALENALRGYDGALPVASHEVTFLEAIGVDRRLYMK